MRTSAVPPVHYRLHRVDNGVVAGAAAHVAGESLADIGAAELLAACDELVGGQQHAGGAEAALRGVPGNELALQFGELAAVGHTFDGVDRLAGNLRREREAAARGAAVD